jgi:Flp pilus assembly CpaE family ATPase
MRGPTLKLTVIGDSAQRRAEVIGLVASISELKVEFEQLTVAEQMGTNGNGQRNGNGGAPTDALIILLTESDEAPFACLHRLASASPRPPLIALLPEHAPTATLRRAVRSGAEEVLFSPLNPEDVTRVLIKISEAKRRTRRRSGGVICSVTSLTGGIGVSSVSINLALAMHRLLGKRTALVDLDLQKGTLAANLNVVPDHSILSLIEGDRDPDSLKVEAAVTKLNSGVYLLAAPRHVEESELISDAAVTMTLQLMRAMFDVVIIDTGNFVGDQTVVAWEESDQLFYLLDQSIASAQRAVRFSDLFTRLELSSLSEKFILYRYLPGYPVTQEQIAQVLRRPINFVLPRDDKTMERIELSGKDLWQVAPGSPLARGFEDLARSIAQPAVAQAPSRSTNAVSRMVSALMSRRRGVDDEAQ